MLYILTSILVPILALLISLVYKFTPDERIAKLPSVSIYRTVLGMIKRLPFDDQLVYSGQVALLHQFKIARAYFQGQWTVIIGCPKLATMIYSDTKLFPKLTPQDDLPNSVFSKLTGHSAFFANGDEWRHQRRSVLGSGTFSLSNNNLDQTSLTTIMLGLNEKINSYNSQKIDTLDLMQRVSFDCLTKHFLNKDLKLINGTKKNLFHQFDNAFSYGFTLLTILFPFAQTPKNPFYRKVYQDIDNWEECLKNLVRCTRERVSKDQEPRNNNSDLLTRMVLSSESVTDDSILSNLKMLFLPSQSLPPALCAALHYLAQNSTIQNMAYAEIISVVGDSKNSLTEDQVTKLPYLSAIIKETLRLYPTLCPPPKRITAQDTTILGTHIPKGTHIMIDTFTIQRDAELWSDPEKFDPSRFLVGSDHHQTPRQAQASGYFPFGVGARRCPGSQIVHHIMANVLSRLITTYHIRYPPPSSLPSLQFKLKLKAQVVLIPDNMELEYLPRISNY